MQTVYITLGCGFVFVVLLLTSKNASDVHVALIPTFALAFLVGVYIISPIPVFAFWRVALLDTMIIAYSVISLEAWLKVFKRT